jgi:hypothetical protein
VPERAGLNARGCIDYRNIFENEVNLLLPICPTVILANGRTSIYSEARRGMPAR